MESRFELIRKEIDYLFNNRVIRKSIISKDSDASINTLLDDDYIYLTLNGSRMLTMFESDSVLLEINQLNHSYCSVG